MGRRAIGGESRGARLGVLAFALTTAATLLVPFPAGATSSPVITSPSSGGLVPAADFLKIRGTADPGSSVEVTEASSPDEPLGTTTANGAGAWTVQTSMPSGTYSVTAIGTGPDGSPSPPSSPVTFEADAVRPQLLVSEPAPYTVYEVGDPPHVGGTSSDENGVLAVQVEYWVLDKRVAIANAGCGACGTGAQSVTWSQTPDLKLGYYYVRVHAIDSAGNRSDTGTTSFFTSGMYERPPIPNPGGLPPIPTIEIPGGGTIQPGAGGNPITIGGRARPDLTVEVFETIDGISRLSQVDTEAGNGRTGWWQTSVRFTGGVYGIQVRGVDGRGRTSPLSARVMFYVDDRRPDVAIESDTQVFTPLQPVVVAGTVTDDRPIAGVALQYWLLDKMVLQSLAQCTGCGTGNATWTHSPSLPYPGYYFVQVYAVDVAGNRSHYETLKIVKTV